VSARLLSEVLLASLRLPDLVNLERQARWVGVLLVLTQVLCFPQQALV